MNDESTPKGAHESATTDFSITDNTLSLDDRHAAWLSGFDYGYAQRVEHDLEEQVRARLHQLSLEALGMARRHAAGTGPAWAALIAWAGEGA